MFRFGLTFVKELFNGPLPSPARWIIIGLILLIDPGGGMQPPKTPQLLGLNFAASYSSNANRDNSIWNFMPWIGLSDSGPLPSYGDYYRPKAIAFRR